MGHKVLVLGQGMALGLCVCDQPCRKPSDPLATILLLATATLHSQPSTGTAVGVALAPFPASSQPLPHPRSCAPWSQRRHSNTPALRMDRREKLAAVFFSFSLVLISPRFCPGCVRQKLVVPLWHLESYFCYPWFLIKSRHLCHFVMEAIPFSASIPAKSSSKRLHSHNWDLTGLPVTAAISVAAVTFYYRFGKSPQCFIHWNHANIFVLFFFFFL